MLDVNTPLVIYDFSCMMSFAVINCMVLLLQPWFGIIEVNLLVVVELE